MTRITLTALALALAVLVGCPNMSTFDPHGAACLACVETKLGLSCCYSCMEYPPEGPYHNLHWEGISLVAERCNQGRHHDELCGCPRSCDCHAGVFVPQLRQPNSDYRMNGGQLIREGFPRGLSVPGASRPEP